MAFFYLYYASVPLLHLLGPKCTLDSWHRTNPTRLNKGCVRHAPLMSKVFQRSLMPSRPWPKADVWLFTFYYAPLLMPNLRPIFEIVSLVINRWRIIYDLLAFCVTFFYSNRSTFDIIIFSNRNQLIVALMMLTESNGNLFLQ